jgi:hypothetical protein
MACSVSRVSISIIEANIVSEACVFSVPVQASFFKKNRSRSGERFSRKITQYYIDRRPF